MTFPLDKLANLGVPVKRLETDSRAVRPGDTFIACPGERVDGRHYIPQSIESGANAVIWESQNFEWDESWDVPNLGVSDLRHKSGWLADAVYGSPSEKLWIVGVTGTNGKTSVSHWLGQAFSSNAKCCALIGTLGNGFPGKLQSSPNTTPDSIRVHGLLASYLSDGAEAVAMEVSSHALAQGRVNGVRFDVALLTNLSRDHLDYHGDMKSYAASKRKLFEWGELKYAVLNLDDDFGADLTEQLRDKSVEVVGYGLSDRALQLGRELGMRMVFGRIVEMNEKGIKLDVHTSWGGDQLHSELIGRFNAANLLGALAVLLVSGVDLKESIRSLGKVQAVTGRMQRLGNDGQPTVIIDYAHTPDALEKVLQALREVCNKADESGSATTRNKLICVFGCGGDRDRGKRQMMGKVAERFADHCIVTSDNPRSEDPMRIIDEIVLGMVENDHRIMVDRGDAIKQAIDFARRNDTVLVAGKGHEEYQEILGVKQPFSDVLIAQEALDSWHSGELA